MKVDEWNRAFYKVFTVTSDDLKECPIDQWYKYEGFKDPNGEKLKSIEDEFNDWSSKLTAPKSLKYYYRVGEKE